MGREPSLRCRAEAPRTAGSRRPGIYREVGCHRKCQSVAGTVSYRNTLDAAEPLTNTTRCGYCRFPYGKTGLGHLGFHAEHIIPRSKAPHLVNELSNLTWACLPCNIHKWAFTEGHDSVTSTDVALYHPRQQTWSDHFSGFSNGKINGQTPTGRGTEGRLQFNGDVDVVAARAEGFSYGWWPNV